jgi:hypothetical protein
MQLKMYPHKLDYSKFLVKQPLGGYIVVPSRSAARFICVLIKANLQFTWIRIAVDVELFIVE